MLSCLAGCVGTCHDAMEQQRLHVVSAAVQQLLYRQFCDVYLVRSRSMSLPGSLLIRTEIQYMA